MDSYGGGEAGRGKGGFKKNSSTIVSYALRSEGKLHSLCQLGHNSRYPLKKGMENRGVVWVSTKKDQKYWAIGINIFPEDLNVVQKRRLAR